MALLRPYTLEDIVSIQEEQVITEQQTTGAARVSALRSVIEDRRSIGKFHPEQPPRELIEQVLEAATWAPNHRLTEPWRFFVLTGDARRRLGEVMGRAHVASLGDSPKDPDVEFEKVAVKPLRAPVMIAVAVEPVVDPTVVEIEEVCAGAAAVQNVLLAAHALGLAAMWRTGDAGFDPAVKAFFDLPPTAHL